ncbi:hypothetical protein PG984_014191 [Apiospora sp. TS-2023a]
MALATFASLHADVLHMIVDELLLQPWTSPAHRANMMRRYLVALMRLNRNIYSALQYRLYRHLRVSTTRSLALLVRTLLERGDLRGVPRSLDAVPDWGKGVGDVGQDLWAEMMTCTTTAGHGGCESNARVRRVLDVIASNSNSKNSIPIANLFMAAFHLMTNLQSVSVTQPLLVGMEPEWLADLVATIRQLDDPDSECQQRQRVPLRQLEIVMKKVHPPVLPGTLASMDLATVETLAVDFGKHDTHRALEELPTLDLPNLARLRLSLDTFRIRCALHYVPSLFWEERADNRYSGPGLKELCLRQRHWLSPHLDSAGLEQTLQNCQDTLETLRLDTLGPSVPFPGGAQGLFSRGLPLLAKLERLDVDAGVLWPRLYHLAYPYYYDHVTHSFAPITYAVLPRSMKALRVAQGSTWQGRRDAGWRMATMLGDLARFVEDHGHLYPHLNELECWTKRRPEDRDCRHGEGWGGQKEALERVAAACARRGIRFCGW